MNAAGWMKENIQADIMGRNNNTMRIVKMTLVLKCK